MASDLIGVVDIGKTHARLTVATPEGDIVSVNRCAALPSLPSAVVQELDVAGIELWLKDSLARQPQKKGIRTLVPIAHGAAAALIDARGRVLFVPDYEDSRFEEVANAYREFRDPFELTYSPFLPLGLNLGRQLYYLRERAASRFERTKAILLYPQYWAWRLAGVTASELTSLGCHSDLWRPLEKRLTALVYQQGWSHLLPPLHKASDVLGNLCPEWIDETGVNPDCRVLCGLHDSNASFLAHLSSRSQRPFSVISSGTWTIVMTRGANLKRVREPLDMLINVDALGAPVATARFMGGREYERIAGEAGVLLQPSWDDLRTVLARNVLALPSFSSSGGPFARISGRIVGAEHLEARERAALATLYVALMTDHLLEVLSAEGELIIDGPLAGNALYCELLAQLRPRSPTYACAAATSGGVTAGIFLVTGQPPRQAYRRIDSASITGLEEYCCTWQACLAESAAAAPVTK